MVLRRAEWAVALLITLFAAWLHLARVGAAGALWRDEAGVLQLATETTLGELVARHVHEAFPPPFLLLVRGWVALGGDADPHLRRFGLLAAGALLAACWLAARSTRSQVPLLALALVAVQPLVVVFAGSLRGYGLGAAAMVAAFACCARLVERGDRRAAFATAAAALVAAQLLYVALPVLAALCLAALVVALRQRRWRLARQVVAIGAVVGLALLPWLGPVLGMRSWSPLVESTLGLRDHVAALAGTAGGPVAALPWVWCGLLAFALLVPLRSVASERAAAAPETPAPRPAVDAGDRSLFCALVVVLAPLAQLALLVALRYWPQPWYFLPLLATVACALDALLAGEPRRRVLRLGAAVLVMVLTALPAARIVRLPMSNMDAVAARLASVAADGDLVVVSPWHLGIGFRHYSRGALRWTTVPPLADSRFHRYDLLRRAMVESDPLAGLRVEIAATLRAGARVWVVGRLAPPEAGAVRRLRPAPHPEHGWILAPYELAWERELAGFLRAHATRVAPMPVPRGWLESAAVVELSGWREDDTHQRGAR